MTRILMLGSRQQWSACRLDEVRIRALLVALSVAVLVVVAGCSSGKSTKAVTATPVLRQTESGGQQTPAVRVVDAFPSLPKMARPTNLIEVPGQGWMLLSLQDGRILGFPKAPSASSYTTVWDNRSATSREGNEEGLLGLALDPHFATNGYIYVYYSAAQGERRTVLSRLETTGSGESLRVQANSELVILQQPQPYSNHKGGQIAFGPDGMLYVGFGDGGAEGDPMGNGQDITRNWLGSIIRIDVRNATTTRPYVVPSDNPFAHGQSGAKPETWAFGLRNPWRFSFDSKTGELWAGDVGQDKHEEVDLIEPGRNYGWNVMEGFHCYRPASGCDMRGLTLPVMEYPHENGACSITGGYVYRGARIPSLDGYYVFADYCSGIVEAFQTSGTDTGSQPKVMTLRPRGPQISSLAQDANGELYLLDFDGGIEALASQ